MFPSAFIIFRLTNVNDTYKGTRIVLAMWSMDMRKWWMWQVASKRKFLFRSWFFYSLYFKDNRKRSGSQKWSEIYV